MHGGVIGCINTLTSLWKVEVALAVMQGILMEAVQKRLPSAEEAGDGEVQLMDNVPAL